MFHAKAWRGVWRGVVRRITNPSYRPSRRCPARRLELEPLEDRCLLSSYTITLIGRQATDVFASPHSALNNAAAAQVVGQDVNDRAYVWDGTHGMQELGTIGKDAYSSAIGINRAGQVVGFTYTEVRKVDKYGFAYLALTSLHAFLWTSTQGMQNIGKNNIAMGINASGEVIGTLNNNQEAAVWNGRWTGLGTLGGNSSWGAGINDYGQATGTSYISSPAGYNTAHAFLWTPSTPGGTKGTMIDLGSLNSIPGYDTSVASAINSQGVVTGETIVSNNGWSHAFVWSPTSPKGTRGAMSDLGALDGVYSAGTSVNSSGTVVGWSTDGSAGYHAVLWQQGSNGSYTMSDLNNLIPGGSGWTLTGAVAINDGGQIVAGALDISGNSRMLLLTPSTTSAALSQPASNSLTATSITLLTPTAGPIGAQLNLVVGSAALTPNMQTSTPASEAPGTTVAPGPIFAATPPSPATGRAVSSPSPLVQTAPKQLVLTRDHVLTEFWDQFLDLSGGDLGMARRS